jgi:hypothetical protein
VHEDCTGTRKVVHPSVHQPSKRNMLFSTLITKREMLLTLNNDVNHVLGVEVNKR